MKQFSARWLFIPRLYSVLTCVVVATPQSVSNHIYAMWPLFETKTPAGVISGTDIADYFHNVFLHIQVRVCVCVRTVCVRVCVRTVCVRVCVNRRRHGY